MASEQLAAMTNADAIAEAEARFVALLADRAVPRCSRTMRGRSCGRRDASLLGPTTLPWMLTGSVAHAEPRAADGEDGWMKAGRNHVSAGASTSTLSALTFSPAGSAARGFFVLDTLVSASCYSRGPSIM